MKESIGGTQIFAIVIVLVLLFAGLMAFTINRSNAFAVKDQLISIIEKNGGFDMDSEINSIKDETRYPALMEIVNSLQSNSYRQSGDCDQIENDNFSNSNDKASCNGYERDGRKTSGNNKSSFCICKIQANDVNGGVMESYYYQIYVFYSLDLPIINSLFNFREIGETKILYW